jgi:hypothetical protein
MEINTSKLYAVIISACLILTGQLKAGELNELIDLKKAAHIELAALKATGIGKRHPQIVVEEEQLIEIEGIISTSKDSHEETVILLQETHSIHMQGHPMFGKTIAKMHYPHSAAPRVENKKHDSRRRRQGVFMANKRITYSPLKVFYRN